MRHTRIKIVRAKNGKNLYYLGDGLWFGRISEEKALNGLAEKRYFLWESSDPSDRC